MSRLDSWIRIRGFPVGIAVFVTVFILAGFSIFRFLQLNKTISATNASLIQVIQLQTRIERLETAARGFALTRDPIFQNAYRQTRDDLVRDMLALIEAIHERHEDELTAMEASVHQRAGELDELMDMAQSRPAADMAKHFRVDTIRKLRDLNRQIEIEERAVLTASEREANGLAKVAAVLMVLGAGIALFFTVTSYRSLKATSREWQAARESALEASRLKSDFLATMSHEIRTPMNGVMGMATLLLNTPLQGDQLSYVKTIKSSADSLLSLINRILDHSKIEAGRLELECKDFEFKAVFDSVLDLLRYWAQSKDVELALEWSEGLPKYLWGDPNRLRQVLVNLVSNALKFTDKGFVQVYVEQTAVANDRYTFRVEVQDTGRGIAQDLQSRLFQKFSQVHSKGPSGSGLGLMIARELVNAMGGEIGVDSEEGAGSRFWFTFKAEASKSARREAGGVAGKERPQLAGHVLIVEDQFINQAVVGKFLESFGLSYSLVREGQAAVEAVRTGHYDLILMDCQMQGMDGYQATEAIRKWERQEGRKAVPIVAVTAEGMNEDRDRCFSVGMNDFLSKPVDIERLHSVLERFLPASRRREFEGQALKNLEGYQSGNRPLRDVLIEDFCSAGKKQISEMESAIAASDENALHQLAHALKSTGRTLGLIHFGQLCEDLETSKSADGSVDSKFAELQRAYERGCDWLQSTAPELR